MDARHVLNFTSVAETPKFANRTVNMLGSGWRLSALYRASTGAINAANASSGMRTVTLGSASAGQRGNVAGGDVCFCDNSNQRPNLLLPNQVYLDKSGRANTQYLNPAAFGSPAPGTLGNLGRVTLSLPLTWQFDVALARTFHIRESQSFEFRAEAFNVLNSFRPGVPPGAPNTVQVVDTNLTSGQFGRILTSLEPRVMQFAVKFSF